MGRPRELGIAAGKGSAFLIRRRKAYSGWTVAVLAVLLVSVSRNAFPETIRISGTGGAVGTMRILGEAFRKANPGIKVEILPGMGSSGGIKAVLAGRLDIGLSGRTLTGAERAEGVVETKYARSPFVFIANRNLEMTGVTMKGVAEIYNGKRDWENGQRIRLVLRPVEDSDTPVLKRMSPAMSVAVDTAMRREGMIVATTDQEAVDIIEQVRGAFGAATLSLVISEKRAVRILSLDGITPSVQTLSDRSYPYAKTFFMVTRRNPTDSVRRFIDFVGSPRGSAILAENGQAAVPQKGALP